MLAELSSVGLTFSKRKHERDHVTDLDPRASVTENVPRKEKARKRMQDSRRKREVPSTFSVLFWSHEAIWFPHRTHGGFHLFEGRSHLFGVDRTTGVQG